MFPPFSLPLVFCSPRHGFPHDDFSCHAMFGSSIHHRTVIGFFTTSQSFPHLILVPLGAYRFYQNLFLPDSRRFLAGKFSRTRIIPFFKEYIAANLHTATHLKARLVNITLLVVCGAISLLFMISMVCELAQDGSLSK